MATFTSTFALMLCLVVALLANTVSAVSNSIYLNCGGPLLSRDSLGNVWTGDDLPVWPNSNVTYYNTGKNGSTVANISGTDDAFLYQTERWDKPSGAEMSYNIPGEYCIYSLAVLLGNLSSFVHALREFKICTYSITNTFLCFCHYDTVENGTYDVLLHFAEIWSGGQEPDARKFNVWLEGDLVLEEYDMYAMYGGFTAIIESFTTTVDDEWLTIDFVHGSENNPKVREPVSIVLLLLCLL